MTSVVKSVDDLRAAIVGSASVLPVAGRTKPALWQSASADVRLLDVSGLRGVVDYDPAELTFTARAATPVAEVQAMLAEHGQHLPFDPPLGSAGATLGGTVAAGISGANAFRHGGIRDFVIGVQFVDGTGTLVVGGGRVVKNAAGFDLPKLMVGSMGRLGVLVTLSFKVFPRPQATLTVRFRPLDLRDALSAMTAVARGPLQAEAVDIDADSQLLIRLGGARAQLDSRARRCEAVVGTPAERLEGEDDAQLWADAARFRWLPEDAILVRVAVTPRTAVPLRDALGREGARVRFSLGANVAWVAWPEERGTADLDRLLNELDLGGMSLIGPASLGLLGVRGPASRRDRP